MLTSPYELFCFLVYSVCDFLPFFLVDDAERELLLLPFPLLCLVYLCCFVLMALFVSRTGAKRCSHDGVPAEAAHKRHECARVAETVSGNGQISRRLSASSLFPLLFPLSFQSLFYGLLFRSVPSLVSFGLFSVSLI